MKRKSLRGWTVVGISVTLLLAATPIHAQEADATSGTTATTGGTKSRRTRALSATLELMGREANATAVADSTLTGAEAIPPSDATTLENIEAQLLALAKTLPRGTKVLKLYLPAPKAGRRYTGDDLSAYVEAQSRLWSAVGSPAPGGAEILGQKIAPEQKIATEQWCLTPYLAALGMQPVYLLTNPALGKPAPEQWGTLPPEERRRYADQQAEQILRLDPALRDALLQQNFLIFNRAMRQMTPEQRQTMMNGLAAPGENIRFVIKTPDAPEKP